MIRAQSLLRGMLTCVLLAAVLAVTAAQASAQDITVRGTGTCQAYLDAQNNNNVQEAVKQLTWLLGYLSGIAVAKQVDILGNNNSADVLLDWANTYCQRYPTKYLSDAGDLYYRYRLEQIKASNQK